MTTNETDARLQDAPEPDAAVPEPAAVADSIEAGSLLEATPECLVVAADDGRIVYANRNAATLTGFTRHELVGKHIEMLVGANLLEAGDLSRIDAVCRTADGATLPVEVHVGVLEHPTRLLVVTLRDSTELQLGRESLYEAEAKYRSLVEHIPAVVYLDPVDEDQTSIYVSPQIRDLVGIAPEVWLEDHYAWRRHVHPEDIDRAWDEYQQAYQALAPLNHEYRMVHEDGTIKWVLEQAYPVDDEDGNPWLIQGVIFDITSRKQAEEQVSFLAYHDKLTGLPNRHLFEEMLDQAIARARRNDTGIGVVFLDLDNFKLVNDSLGHHAGDLLLAQLADRLRESVRDTDLVARQGGDEFMILLSDLERGGVGAGDAPDPAVVVAEAVAVRVREAMTQPFDLGGTAFYATGSIGISLFPQDATDAPSLLKNADHAMYQSKRHEPGGYTVFATRGEDAMQRLSLTTRLREAVQQEPWILHWQPIVELATGRIVSVEGLIRWPDPAGGLTAPGEFIPLAEELGLIEAIGDWVLGEIGRQRSAWAADGLEMSVGFNLSPRQLWSAHLSEKIMASVRRAGVDPKDVTVEITESTAMADPDRTQKVLAELNAWGFKLALDDFGTGYSSLARLKHMPVDVLKIDRSFIRDVARDASLASMVKAMIQLAEGLDMVPLAEGIETSEELDFLVEHGCPLGQGFLFSRAVPAVEVAALMARPSLLP